MENPMENLPFGTNDEFCEKRNIFVPFFINFLFSLSAKFRENPPWEVKKSLYSSPLRDII
jgi:hypothetical protein